MNFDNGKQSISSIQGKNDVSLFVIHVDNNNALANRTTDSSTVKNRKITVKNHLCVLSPLVNR